MIPHYAQYYGIKNAKKFSYIEYCELIDEIRKKSSEMTGETISRNGFDHLLWYYYKGRIN